MRIVTTKDDLRATLVPARRAGQQVGLVPTMGYLHEGHVSHMERSSVADDLTVATIFVNPLQFAAGEDLDTYPRDPDGDRAKAEVAGVHVLFCPSEAEMYPRPVRTTVAVDVARGRMEAAARPTHFDGVATVVTKLFSLVGACRAYFGEKDYQQLAVVRRLVVDLDLPVEVVAGATVREDDGLAMSSRNAYLTASERRVAPTLYRALRAGADQVAAGERRPEAVVATVTEMIAAEPRFHLDYVEVVDAATLEPFGPANSGDAGTVRGEVRILAAARLGIPRLLDNVGVTVS